MASPKTLAKNAKLAEMFPTEGRWIVQGTSVVVDGKTYWQKPETYRTGANAMKRMIALTRKLARAEKVRKAAEKRRRLRQGLRGKVPQCMTHPRWRAVCPACWTVYEAMVAAAGATVGARLAKIQEWRQKEATA